MKSLQKFLFGLACLLAGAEILFLIWSFISATVTFSIIVNTMSGILITYLLWGVLKQELHG